MEIRELTCINCPMGCLLTVETDGDEIKDISGYTCPRGRTYAEKEVTNPTRIVTSTVKVVGGKNERVACKTEHDIPKDKIFAVMEAINAAEVQAPVVIGEVLISNVAGTGVDVVATAHAI
ncbi:MAG: DUF1667 domain-containing protein [Ruminococcus sp.]|uniref:DUF1667 domain-containing protein n=1 Tax=Ruminococcus sp. TaxID=41978 RepID=UPI00287382ED|nr:DUF1667 domain-containing protein [Ruminococcus sp.]MBQ3284651.1 DUF1667 domain-containing protein [Ruminococcus sp.]